MSIEKLDSGLRKIDPRDADLAAVGAITELMNDRDFHKISFRRAADEFPMFRTLSIGIRNYLEESTDPELPIAKEHVECTLIGARIGMIALSRLALHNDDLREGLQAVTAEPLITAMHTIIEEQRMLDTDARLLNRRRDVSHDYPAVEVNLFATFTEIINRRQASLAPDMSAYNVEDQAADVADGLELGLLTFDEVVRGAKAS